MNLRAFLRNDFSKNLRGLLIKEKCEICGEEKSLVLHHEDRFHNLLVETLSELELDEYDTECYSTEELNNISEKMLGKQVKMKYKTVCKTCHFKIHKNEDKTKYLKDTRDVGSYIFVNCDKFIEEKISEENATRILRLACNMKYANKDNKCYIKLNTNSRKNITTLDEVESILNMSKPAFRQFVKSFIDTECPIIEKDDSGYYIDKSYVYKGLKFTNYKKEAILFVSNFADIYDKSSNRSHALQGRFIYATDCINRKFNTVCEPSKIEIKNLDDIYTTKHRTIMLDIIKIKTQSIRKIFHEDLATYVKTDNDNVYFMFDPTVVYFGDISEINEVLNLNVNKFVDDSKNNHMKRNQ